jgi:MoaA/NifB/PqqE/SkfB family radical SAM enzyme
MKTQLASDFLRSFLRCDNKAAKIINAIRFLLIKQCGREAWFQYQSQFPIHAIVLTTLRCNMKCPDCFYRDKIREGNASKDLTLEGSQYLYSKGFFKTVCRVALVGGEPLLNKEILDILRFFRSKGLLISITTNGLLLNKKNLTELTNAGLNWLNISIYDYNRDYLVKLFSEVLKDVFDMNKISLVYHSSEIDSYKSAYEFAKSLKVRNLILGQQYNLDEKRSDEERNAFAASFDELCNNIKRERRLSLYAFTPYRYPGSGKRRCSVAMSAVAIAPDGGIAPCCHLFPDNKFASIDNPERLLDFKYNLFQGTVPGPCIKCFMLSNEVY